MKLNIQKSPNKKKHGVSALRVENSITKTCRLKTIENI